MQKGRKKFLFLSCLIWTAYLCAGCGGRDIELSSGQAESLQRQTDPYGDLREQTEGKTEPAGDEAQGMIYVQVCGAVKEPGVYGMRDGDRVFEAIALAGGLTEDANAQSVNQASRVEDGQMITIYTNEEWEKTREGADIAPAEPADGRIDINRADESLLTTLPGIGKVIAGRIVTYREENGAFSSVEDIKKVSGIGDALFQKIKDLIRV